MTSKPQEKSTFRLSLASCVDGIREGWRRMRGEAVRRVTDLKEIGEGKNLYNIRQETPVRRREKGSQTSFEKFLHSLPKVDAVDRTVDWVLAQPNIEEKEPNRFANLAARGFLLPRATGTLPFGRMHMDSARENVDEENFSSHVSLSRYESERGTVGRGTPPVHKEGQPRLDLLLRQMHKQQERKAMQRSHLERENNQSSYMPKMPAVHLEGVTADLLPFLDQTLNKHQDKKNYEQYPMCGEDVMVCEWGECRVTFPSRRQLLAHVSEHIHSGRVVGELWCRWRRCRQLGRTWHSRQALLQHITKAHCTSKADEKEVMMVTPHFDIACHIDEKQASKHITTRVCQRRASITSARRNATPKMTMVTGLQIRPALVTEKDQRITNHRKEKWRQATVNRERT